MKNSVGQKLGYFFVREAASQAIGYFYYEEEPGLRSTAKLLTKDEARRIAANVAKPPELFRRQYSRLPMPERLLRWSVL